MGRSGARRRTRRKPWVVGYIGSSSTALLVRRVARALEEEGHGRCHAMEWIPPSAEGSSPPGEELDILVVEVSPGEAAAVGVPELRDLVGELAWIRIIAYADGAPLAPADWVRLGREGLASAVVRPEELRSAVERWLVPGRVLGVVRGLEGRVDDWAVRLVRNAVPLAARRRSPAVRKRLTVAELAAVWQKGASPEGLKSALRRAGLPPPGWINRWLTLAAAAAWYDRLGTWERAAWAAGFPGRRELRRAVRRLTGQGLRRWEAGELAMLFLSRCRGVPGASGTLRSAGDRT